MLPIELLSEIADYLPPNEIPQLATTSRQFHGVATRLLYQKISLVNDSTLNACINTLAFNQFAAGHVRSLEIFIPR